MEKNRKERERLKSYLRNWLNKMFTLYKKELNYYLNNPVGYIIIILFALFANFLFIKDIFVVGYSSMRSFFGIIPWLFMIFIPAVSMRAFSEEKRTNTIEVLLTLSLSETQIVLAKFFSLLTICFIGLILTLGLPLSLSFLTKIYLPEIFIGYMGLIFVASSFISLSIFFSSITKNQAVSFLVSALTLFFLLTLSSDFIANIFPRIIQDVLSYLAPLYHLSNFIKGVLDLRSVVYFVGFTMVFLLLNIIELEKRD